MLEILDHRSIGELTPLAEIDPVNELFYRGSEAEAKQETENYRQKLGRQQAVLYAQHKQSILVVLQALDAGGKDGTVNHVFSALNPKGVRVAAFKQPSPVELAHDFLWRVHPHAPACGEIAIFNRSHYEDVLVTRVHKLIDKATWTERYQRIRDFEALLVENGTTILKFFLHISKEEQLQRFAQRLDDPARNWKISESDYSEHALWDDYIEAFEDAIRATSTREAPWDVIPSNHKWFRNLAVCRSWRIRWPISASPSRRRRLTSPTSGASIMPPSRRKRRTERRPDARAWFPSVAPP